MEHVKRVFLLAAVLLFSISVGAGFADSAPGDSMTGKSVYVCACGDACNCDTVSAEPGKCPCGKEMMQRQVLKDDGSNLYVCNCGAACNCTGVSADGTRCTCGKELKALPKSVKVGCACCQMKKSES